MFTFVPETGIDTGRLASSGLFRLGLVAQFSV
jgi:hypothetical protein